MAQATINNPSIISADLGMTGNSISSICGKPLYVTGGNYTAGANIDITDQVISGKSWTSEISNATTGKYDTTAFAAVSGTFLTAHQSLTGLMSASLIQGTDNVITGYAGSAFSAKGGGGGGSYIQGPNIDITNNVISGRDWTPEIQSATSGKLNTTAFSTVSGTFLTAHQSLTALMSADKLSFSAGTITAYNGSAFPGKGIELTGVSPIKIADGLVSNNSDSVSVNGTNSWAEGKSTTAAGSYAHAEGQSTSAGGTASHSEGNATTAAGNYSHAEGQGTVINDAAGHVQGKYNSTSSNASFVIGNGTSTTRSDAVIVDWSGNVSSNGSQFILGKASPTTSAGIIINANSNTGTYPSANKAVINNGCPLLNFHNIADYTAAEGGQFGYSVYNTMYDKDSKAFPTTADGWFYCVVGESDGKASQGIAGLYVDGPAYVENIWNKNNIVMNKTTSAGNIINDSAPGFETTQATTKVSALDFNPIVLPPGKSCLVEMHGIFYWKSVFSSPWVTFSLSSDKDTSISATASAKINIPTVCSGYLQYNLPFVITNSSTVPVKYVPTVMETNRAISSYGNIHLKGIII